MIPGPTEFDEDVLRAIGEPTPSHVAPDFITTFGKVTLLCSAVFAL